MAKRRKATSCFNCDTPLLNGENFCPTCGQENHSKQASIKQLSTDFLGDYLAFDSRMFRSIIPLLIEPGRITIDYLDGKRQRFIPPIRVFLFLSFIYFGLSYLIGLDSTAFQLSSSDSEKAGEVVKEVFEKNFNLLLFMYTPLFALLIRPFFKSEKRHFYVNFFVYTLHLFSVFFIVLTIQILLFKLSSSVLEESVNEIVMTVIRVATFLYLVYYSIVSMKRVFEKKYTILRFVAIFCISSLTFLALLVSAILLLFALNQ